MRRKWGGEEDGKCDERTALRLKRDLERVGGEWRTAKDRSWRLLIREYSERKIKKKTTVIMANFTPDDRDAKRRTTI